MTLLNFNHLPEVPPQNSITWGIRGFNIQIRGRGTGHKYSVHSTHSPLTAPGFYLKAAPWGWGLADTVEGHSRSHAPWNKIGYKEKGQGWACSMPSPGSGLFLRPLQVQEEAKQGMTRGCHLTGYSKRSVLHMRLQNFFFFLPLNTCVYLYPSGFLHGVLHSHPSVPSLNYRETHHAVECERVWKVRPRKVRRLVPRHTASWGPAHFWSFLYSWPPV